MIIKYVSEWSVCVPLCFEGWQGGLSVAADWPGEEHSV